MEASSLWSHFWHLCPKLELCSVAGYKTFSSTRGLGRAGHRLNEPIWRNQALFLQWICAFVIFKNMQCDTTQSSFTDFMFKVCEDRKRLNWTNSKKNVIMFVLIILKLNQLYLWPVASLKVNKKWKCVHWNLCLYTKKFSPFLAVHINF